MKIHFMGDCEYIDWLIIKNIICISAYLQLSRGPAQFIHQPYRKTWEPLCPSSPISGRKKIHTFQWDYCLHAEESTHTQNYESDEVVDSPIHDQPLVFVKIRTNPLIDFLNYATFKSIFLTYYLSHKFLITFPCFSVYYSLCERGRGIGERDPDYLEKLG